MTLIVFDQDHVCADRAWHYGEQKMDAPKYWKAGKGDSWVLGAGSVPSISAMRLWLERGSNPDDFPRDGQCEIIHINEGRIDLYLSDFNSENYGNKTWALGSAAEFAHGMLVGGTPAIDIIPHASEHCSGISLDFDCYDRKTKTWAEYRA